jgi:hypothetical protein
VFTKAVVGLKPGTTYAYRAFATNAAGTNYTTATTFTTSAVAPVMASIPTHTSVTSTLATLGGKVNSTGGSAITARGVVYSVFATEDEPTLLTGTAAPLAPALGGTTIGVFTKAITGLTPGTKYAYRAYATNAVGTTYSATVGTFTTLKGRPLISLPTSASVTSSGATLGGTVTGNGGDTLTARGVVYSLTAINANPKLGLTGVKKVTHVTPDSVSLFTVAVTGLQGGKSYSYRAYATNSKGTTYTTVGTFTTSNGAPTVASTPTKSTIAIKSATLGGRVIYSNGATITERGIVYSVFSENATPVLGDVGDDAKKKIVTGRLGSFSAIVSGLTANTKYAFRSYATNSVGTSYSSVGTFTTLEAAASLLAGPVASASAGDTSETYYTVGEDGLRYLTIVVNKEVGATVEVSGNLTDWFSGSSHTTVVSDDAGVLKVRDNTPVTAESKRYIRLKP